MVVVAYGKSLNKHAPNKLLLICLPFSWIWHINIVVVASPMLFDKHWHKIVRSLKVKSHEFVKFHNCVVLKNNTKNPTYILFIWCLEKCCFQISWLKQSVNIWWIFKRHDERNHWLWFRNILTILMMLFLYRKKKVNKIVRRLPNSNGSYMCCQKVAKEYFARKYSKVTW